MTPSELAEITNGLRLLSNRADDLRSRTSALDAANDLRAIARICDSLKVSAKRIEGRVRERYDALVTKTNLNRSQRR